MCTHPLLLQGANGDLQHQGYCCKQDVQVAQKAELAACTVLDCRETTEGLGRQIAKELKPGLTGGEDAADLSEEESAFTGVASQCLSVLVLGINTRLDACLQVRASGACLGSCLQGMDNLHVADNHLG